MVNLTPIMIEGQPFTAVTVKLAWRRHQQKNADENDRYDHADRIDFDRLPAHL